MLSQIEVERKVMFEFLQKETIDVTKKEHHCNQSLEDEARNFINELERFEAWQDIDVPIANLWHDGEPVSLGFAPGRRPRYDRAAEMLIPRPYGLP